MLDFGDELAFETFKIPWLIWIQLFVFLLLLALLFCFSIVALDPSHESVTSSASTTAPDFNLQSLPINNHSTPVINSLHNTRGVENLSIKGEVAANGSTEIVKEQIAEGEASPLYFLHPCYYFKLARVAFLKCLGLDSTPESDDPSTQKHSKRKES
ncbi:hypothetical protein VNO77_00858 [Canavalia gladiata]|uniref:Uncharacterized protein n=1 Tax=Canavalia gladiata TaxID=3824 RepID=A0AAN9MQV8_CANGL